MARSDRPASESYQSAYCSVGQSLSSSSEAGVLDEDDDRTPIFSLSKSSVDVVTATGPPHKRDLAWMRLDLKRSSSTNTHPGQNQETLDRHHHKWRHNSHQFSVTTQNEDLRSPPPLSERWISNMHRWSGCSSSTHSRSSTPDTVVWKEGSSRSCLLNQEGPGCFTPDSPMSKITSPPTTPSPLISPFRTPTLPPADHLTPSALTLSMHQQSEYSPHPQPTCPDKRNSLEKLLFQFPSPVPSCASLAEAGQRTDSACLVNDVSKDQLSPRDTQIVEDKGEEMQAVCKQKQNPSAEKTHCKAKLSGCHYLLSLEQSCQMGKGWRSPLVSSLSDSQLGELSRFNLVHLEGTTNNPKSELFREEGTMTSQLEMMDAAVQTDSSLGSCYDSQKNISNSNSGSHSLLGSPPGSRLNLKDSVGSHSNLVSASSSMFPVSSGEEEEKQQNSPKWDITSASAQYVERKRSCLKAQSEECDELGRRGSMKQVLWDEDGLTWDIHGASVDPEELSTAIQKHLDLKNSPQPQRHSSKKKKAPMPPLISNMVTTMAPDTSPPAMSIKCMVEGESQETLETEAEREVEQVAGGKKQEKEGDNCIRKTEEQGKAQEIEEDRSGEKSANSLKSPVQGSGHSKKKIVIRSLKRSGWCGGSRKKDD